MIGLYDRFEEAAEQVAMNAAEQLQKLHGTAFTDDIALDFIETGMGCAEKLFAHGLITCEQLLPAKKIDEKSVEMSRSGELRADEALCIHA